MEGSPLKSAEKMLGLTMYGRREWLAAFVVADTISVGAIVVGVLTSHVWYGVGVMLLSTLCGGGVALFFRDPERCLPEDGTLLVSPADGVVRDLEETAAPEGESFSGERSVQRIGIFLSIFNVHLNRAPCDWSVKERLYRKGHYHDARNPLAGQENEALLLGGQGHAGGLSFPLAVRQISGAIARRIVCEAKPGDAVSRGARYGMLKFGSRTEVYLPTGQDIEINVRVGDVVKAGETVIATVRSGEG